MYVLFHAHYFLVRLVLLSHCEWAKFDKSCKHLFLLIKFIPQIWSIDWYFISSLLKKSQISFFPAHTTTEKGETLLTKTDTVGKTTTLISPQPITEKNNTIGIYKCVYSNMSTDLSLEVLILYVTFK